MVPLDRSQRCVDLMGRLFQKLLKWVLKKSDVPDIWEDFWSLEDDWEHSQCNDRAVYSSDPHGEASAEARRLAKLDPIAGFLSMLRLAELGSIWSMFSVGYAYQFGLGVEADLAKSEEWYRKAFERGAQRAQLHYGALVRGRSDWQTAENIFSVGVVDDWAPAMLWFSWAKIQQSDTRKTFAEVSPLLERGSAKGSLGCELILAKQLQKGRGGLRRIPEGYRRHMALGAIMTRHATATAEKASVSGSETAPCAAPTIH